MPEAAANLEPQNNNLYSQAALKLAGELLGEQSYTKLSERDLRDKGMIGHEETMADFVSREMRFDESLQPEALAMFCNEAPPPVDTTEVNQWEGKELFPRAEEDQVRLKMLGVVTDDENQVEASPKPEGLKRLVSGIVSEAAILDLDGDSTADPEPFRRNIDTLMKLLDSEPEVMTLNGQQCWGVHIPRETKDGSAVGFLAGMLMGPTVGDYIVVADPDRNAELSTLVFSDQELLRHMVKKNIRHAQSQARTKIDNELRTIGLEKYDEAKTKVNDMNNPARVGFFDRLIQDSVQGDIELISVFRDRKDVETFQGERQYDPNRVGSESGESRFMVSKGRANELIFAWDGNETTWETVEKDGKKIRQMVQTPKKLGARVRNNNGKLEYADLSGVENEVKWLEEPDYQSQNADKIHNIFRNIEVITMDEWLEFGEKKSEPVAQIIRGLNASASSVEYANKFREFGIAHYPTTEIIVNPGKKVNYVVDSTTPPSDSYRDN